MPKVPQKPSLDKPKPYPKSVQVDVEPKKGEQVDMSSKCIAPIAGKLVKELEQSYASAADKNDSLKMKKYLRNQFEFYGILTPQRNLLTKEVISKYDKLTSSDIISVVQLLWSKDEREYQYCGIELLKKHKKILSVDVDTCSSACAAVELLLVSKSWWDTVDILAANVIGHFARAQPDLLSPMLDVWITSDNMWLRRTAIIHQLSYRNNTDQNKLFRYCLQCCGEKEFFIQKAIGWALREYHKTQPKAVKDFVTNHTDKLAKLSIREALKHEKKK